MDTMLTLDIIYVITLSLIYIILSTILVTIVNFLLLLHTASKDNLKKHSQFKIIRNLKI